MIKRSHESPDEQAPERNEKNKRVAMIEVSPRRGETEDALASREIIKDGQPCLISVVADGHGSWGGQIARRAVTFLMNTAASSAHIPDKVWIQQTFKNLEQKIEAEFPHDERGGSTVTFVWLQGRNITLGYAGDSEANIWRGDGIWTRLTPPHWYGTHPRETRRLDALGAQTLGDRDTPESKRPQAILRPDGKNQALAVSRAIGDTGFEPLLSHEPDVATFALSHQDKFLLVASDGLWSQIWRNTHKRHQIQNVLRVAHTVEEARQKLNEILSRWQGDDIAVLLIDVTQKTDS